MHAQTATRKVRCEVIGYQRYDNSHSLICLRYRVLNLNSLDMHNAPMNIPPQASVTARIDSSLVNMTYELTDKETLLTNDHLVKSLNARSR